MARELIHAPEINYLAMRERILWEHTSELDWPDIPFSSEETINQELIMYGIIHFDNLITGIISIFQMITLEGWTTIMYNIGDAI